MHLSKVKKPVLVTGAHRSGTTWVGRTIYQHPGVRYVHEPFNVTNPNPYMDLQVKRWLDDAAISAQKEDIYRAFTALLHPNPFAYAAEICRNSGLNVLTPVRYMKHLLYRPRIVVKDPIALLSAGWLHDTFDFQVIVTIRTPLAFVSSIKKSGWDLHFESLQEKESEMKCWLRDKAGATYCERLKFGGGGDWVDRAILMWNTLHFVILGYQEKYPDWLFVRYEDAAKDPVGKFAEIFSYLDLDFDQPIQDYIQEFTGKANVTDLATADYRPLDAMANLGAWKNRLSDEEVDRVRAATSVIAGQLYTEEILL